MVKLKSWYMEWWSRRRAGVSRPCSCSTRMYCRENSEVVKPTNAVSATRNTLNGSTKNSLSIAMNGPSPMTRNVRAAAATSVPKLATTLTSAAKRRCPTTASTVAPMSGRPRTARISFTRVGSLVLLELLEMLQVEAVELLADLEEEHTENQHGDQDVERDAELDDHRHPVGRAGRREEETVFHRQEADHLRNRLAARDHHQERKHHARKRNAQRRAGYRAREL